jgi:hypothetical protein
MSALFVSVNKSFNKHFKCNMIFGFTSLLLFKVVICCIILPPFGFLPLFFVNGFSLVINSVCTVDKKSIFSKIVDAIDSINLKSKSINEKCVKVCESIFNNFCYNGGDFHLYKSFSNDFFKSIISSNRDRHIVLEILKGSEILLCDESYNVDRGIGKGYKFNSDFINPECEFKVVSFKRGNIKEETLKSCSNFLFLESKEQFNYSIQSKSIINNLNNSTISLLLPHFETYINQGLQSADFDEKVYEWIKNYEVKRDSIKVNDEITDEYINLFYIHYFRYCR